MEQHGLDQVIEDLKQRGVQAGEQEAARLVDEAKKRAEDIVVKARAEAESIRKAADESATATKKTMEAELAQAARVGVAAFKQAIESAFVVPALDESLAGALSSERVLEESILELVKAFAEGGMAESRIELLLPEKRRQELEGAFLQKLKARAGDKVDVRFDDAIRFGFRIGPAGGGFSFDLSDEGFREIFVKFIAPRFRAAFYAGGDKA